MITKLPPVGFKILQISLQIMHHFLSRFCWPLLKVHFAGHPMHVKLVLDIGMWVTQLGMWITQLGMWSLNWECGSLVTNYLRAPAQRQMGRNTLAREFNYWVSWARNQLLHSHTHMGHRPTHTRSWFSPPGHHARVPTQGPG